MKESFRNSLEVFNEMAKDEMEEGNSRRDLERIYSAIRWHLDQRARRRKSDYESQRDIFLIQKEKQRIMQDLKADIEALDSDKEKPAELQSQKNIRYSDGQLVYESPQGGTPRIISVGELMTDGEWGVEYHPDPETVPRNIHKRFIIETAKRRLKSLLNEQIFIDELSSSNTGPLYRKAFEGLRDYTYGERIETGPLAEKLVRVFLKKLVYDFDLPVSIAEGDAHQDVVNKIDFIVRKKHRDRGVKVEGTEGDNVGIQFTTRDDKEGLEHKQEQIDRVKARDSIEEEKIEDLVLVSVPMKGAAPKFREWLKDDPYMRESPDKALLDPEKREKIFRGILENILSEEEITAYWDMIKLQG